MATDFSDLDKLAADLTSAPAEARPFIRKALQFTAFNIRDEWRAEAARTGLEAYGASVGYETTEKAQSIEAEIGPTPGRRQGSFGFMEDGGGGVRSAPQHAGRDALKHNEQDFYDGLEKALADGLEKAVGG
ncbi:hypothetical protein [Microbacterium sp. LWH11-1.2]|uniref:hypothetical protein n=1 Tax=Microbacterium sp. LWH11-1.2 TaxID=3135258 RepID=UPI00313A46D9